MFSSIEMLKLFKSWVLVVFISATGCSSSSGNKSDSSTACETGQERCGAECIDLSVDALNCGACGVACDSEEYCSGGVCNEGCSACTDDEVCVQSFSGDCTTSRTVSCVTAPDCANGCSNNSACDVQACGGSPFSCMNGPTCSTPVLPGVDVQCEGF